MSTRSRGVALATLVALLGLLLAPMSSASASPTWLSHLRDATKKYQSVATAKADGYGKFKDANGIACIDMPGMGGMGIHYVNGDLVGDAQILKYHPEALVYQPTANGLKLVAMEYIVFKKAWRAEHSSGRPHLFGKAFLSVGKDNRYGIPPFFERHVWAFKGNPAGMFADFNPRVSCP